MTTATTIFLISPAVNVWYHQLMWSIDVSVNVVGIQLQIISEWGHSIMQQLHVCFVFNSNWGTIASQACGTKKYHQATLHVTLHVNVGKEYVLNGNKDRMDTKTIVCVYMQEREEDRGLLNSLE